MAHRVRLSSCEEVWVDPYGGTRLAGYSLYGLRHLSSAVWRALHRVGDSEQQLHQSSRTRGLGVTALWVGQVLDALAAGKGQAIFASIRTYEGEGQDAHVLSNLLHCVAGAQDLQTVLPTMLRFRAMLIRMKQQMTTLTRTSLLATALCERQS